MNEKIDPLSVLPDIAAEVTAHRGLVAVLREYLKSQYDAAPNLSGLADLVVTRLRGARDEANRRREFMQHVTTLAGCENSEQALAAWIRESAVLRRSIRAGE